MGRRAFSLFSPFCPSLTHPYLPLPTPPFPLPFHPYHFMASQTGMAWQAGQGQAFCALLPAALPPFQGREAGDRHGRLQDTLLPAPALFQCSLRVSKFSFHICVIHAFHYALGWEGWKNKEGWTWDRHSRHQTSLEEGKHTFAHLCLTLYRKHDFSSHLSSLLSAFPLLCVCCLSS